MELTEKVKSCQKLIDSSVLYDIFVSNDRLDIRAKELLRKLAKSRAILLIHPLVIIEVLSLIKYRVGVEGEKIARKELYDIGKYRVLEIKTGLSKQILDLFEKNREIGLIDAILIQYCLEKKTGLVTFDKKQEEVWRRLRKKLETRKMK